jgi:hypothetical protein
VQVVVLLFVSPLLVPNTSILPVPVMLTVVLLPLYCVPAEQVPGLEAAGAVKEQLVEPVAQ